MKLNLFEVTYCKKYVFLHKRNIAVHLIIPVENPGSRLSFFLCNTPKSDEEIGWRKIKGWALKVSSQSYDRNPSNSAFDSGRKKSCISYSVRRKHRENVSIRGFSNFITSQISAKKLVLELQYL